MEPALELGGGGGNSEGVTGHLGEEQEGSWGTSWARPGERGAGLSGKCMCAAQSETGKGKSGRPQKPRQSPGPAVPPSLAPETSTGAFLQKDRQPETEARTPPARWAERGLGGLGGAPALRRPRPLRLCILRVRPALGGLSMNKGCRASSQKGGRRNAGHLAEEGAPKALGL